MGMLDSFNDIPKDYVPRNTSKCPVKKRRQVKTQPPYQRTANSFWWNQGDRFVFVYKPQLSIRVENSAIVIVNDAPILDDIIGFRGQKAYDVNKLISYTYYAGYNDKGEWKQDEKFTIPDRGGQEVLLRNIDWSKVTIKFEIKNFRNETIYAYPTSDEDDPITVGDDDTVEIDIGEDLSALLKFGSYKFLMTLNGVDELHTIYLQNIFDISILQRRVSNNREAISTSDSDEDYDLHLILDGGEESDMSEIDCGCGW